MKWTLKNIFLIGINLFFINYSSTCQVTTNEELMKQPVYTSIKKAMEHPEQVYRLKLTGNLHCDSIPLEVFQFINLQELTINWGRLNILNHNIDAFQYLVYLDLSNNRLVNLPEEICNLQFLKSLVISRNKIYMLPENIGNLKNLQIIDAWDNQFYCLPASIVKLKDSLKMIDLLQIPIKDEEYNEMKRLLPNTEILFTPVCPCMIDR